MDRTVWLTDIMTNVRKQSEGGQHIVCAQREQRKANA